MDDEKQWRKRFLAYMGARLAGLAVFFLGIAVAYTDLLRPGGWPQVGAIIAILGVLDALLLPRVIKKSWERKEKERR
jgi:hypothetical protein